jgi:hypothetical protein
MKTAIVIMMALTLTVLFGCQVSPRGGNVAKDEGFRIAVPKLGVDVKQGAGETVEVLLQRDLLFKGDVKLQIHAAKGISAQPASVTVKTSEKSEVPFQIAVPQDTPVGEYPVVVKGTPETGAPTSVGFTVKVVAP